MKWLTLLQQLIRFPWRYLVMGFSDRHSYLSLPWLLSEPEKILQKRWTNFACQCIQAYCYFSTQLHSNHEIHFLSSQKICNINRYIDTCSKYELYGHVIMSFHYFLPGSVWENDPIPKSTAPASKTTRSANCRRTTHY